MKNVHEEWRLTTKYVELEIENWSKCDLDAVNLNLHHVKVLSMKDKVKLK